MLTLIAYAASIIVWIRFLPYLRPNRKFESGTLIQLPKISVVVPVRNEEANITQLLKSLLRNQSSIHEIIIVDDQSTDQTMHLAKAFPVKVISAGPRPDGWIGKSWACHVGSQKATGDLLLFTDADTIHHTDGWLQACKFMQMENAAMISAPAFHLNQHWWQKLLGPFHCLMDAGASPYDKRGDQHAYAMGQFLMIRSFTYRAIGGHSSVKHLLAEDAALASRVLQAGEIYRMYNGVPICSVQMYQSFSEFISGWVRLMRLGMGMLSFKVILNSLVPLFAFNVFNLSEFTWLEWIPVLSTLACFAFVQKRIGHFSAVGIFVFPLSVGLFIGIGIYAMLSEWLKLPIVWRGRSYRMNNRPAYPAQSRG